MDLNKWNIQELIKLQMQVNNEISARIVAVESMDNNFHTYSPNGSSEDYKVLMEASIELLRKGIGENER